ncbi:MAG: DUF3224 domain-containing protein [Balneolaceae bacterium]|nr:DUF3224 domain-containing protein [Balneolaceae bacterium]
MEARTKFKITGWEEEDVATLQKGGKVTRAHVGKIYEGELNGEGKVEYLMFYRSDGSVEFVGYENVVGSLKGNDGSFVFEHRGQFRNGVAKDTWTVIEGSGGAGLSGLTGEVHFEADHKEEYEVILRYEL